MPANRLVIEQPYFVDIREMRVLGFADVPDHIAAGIPLALGVYWRARGKPEGDYDVVAQLSDASGNIAVEQSSRPANGTHPTLRWNGGEVLLDWHDLALPSDMAPSEYALRVVLRDAETKAVLGTAPVKTIEITS